MHPLAAMRARIDAMNKRRVKLPTGGDLRSTSEAINTSAIAKGQALLRHPKSKLGRK
jgi:hypothetical protein